MKIRQEKYIGSTVPFEEEGKGCNAESGDEVTVGHECENEGAMVENNFAKKLHSGCKYLDGQHGQNGA